MFGCGSPGCAGQEVSTAQALALTHIPEWRGTPGEPKAPTARWHSLVLSVESSNFVSVPEACSGFLPRKFSMTARCTEDCTSASLSRELGRYRL